MATDAEHARTPASSTTAASRRGSTGCAPACSARTTASSRSPGSSSASPARRRTGRRSSPPGSPGLVAGAFSMAGGEYVSVSTQRDTETALLRRETLGAGEPARHGARRAGRRSTRARASTPELAREVAEQLTAQDALARPRRGRARHRPGRADQPVGGGRGVVRWSFAAGAPLPLVAIVVAAARRPRLGLPSPPSSSRSPSPARSSARLGAAPARPRRRPQRRHGRCSRWW